MYDDLVALAARPTPFCAMTTELLWADAHTSEFLLAHHLDGTDDTASRPTDVIERSIAWLTGSLGVGAGTRVLDLGCGPGLYSNRLAAAGAHVTGVDFSARSIGHARASAPPVACPPTYVLGNYLDVALPGTFDVALLIYCDFCALGPEQRGRLLERLRTWLAGGGRFVLDVHGLASLAAHQEKGSITVHPDGGFWSPRPHVEVVHSFVYEQERVTLDKYDLVEAGGSRTVYNWLQHYDPGSIERELAGHGLDVSAFLADLTGAPYRPDGSDFAVVATLRA